MRRVGHSGVWWGACLCLAGCGPSPNTEDECASLEPCGGDLVGTWQLDDVCFLVDPLERLEQEQVCEDYYQEVSYQISGTLSFDGYVFTPSLQQTEILLVKITPACRGASIDETECASIEGELRESEDPTVANCSVVGEDCHCRTTTTQLLIQPEDYVVEGQQVRRLGTGELCDYCVDQEQLKIDLHTDDDLRAVLSLTRTP